jgi:hypothetical protein
MVGDECLYCGCRGAGQAVSIVPEELGGALLVDGVCERCSTVIAALDRALVAYAQLFLCPRMAHPPAIDRIDLGAVYRAIAKIAFHYAAFHLGGNYARRPELDDVRHSICGDAPYSFHPTRVTPISLNVTSTRDHSVMLSNLNSSLHGFVTLYTRHTFLVPLAPADRGVAAIAHEFAVDGSWHRELTVPAILERTRAASGRVDSAPVPAMQRS